MNQLKYCYNYLDGSHTTILTGGEQVGYKGMKKRMTAIALYLIDRLSLPLVVSVNHSNLKRWPDWNKPK